MKHIKAYLLKLLIITVILEISLNLLTALTFGHILIISVAVSLLSYFLGDLLILSATNNTTATIADAGIAFFTIYMFNFWRYFAPIGFYDALFSAIFIGIGEAFFHKYVASRVFPDRKARI